MVERLLYTQDVGGSSPSLPTIFANDRRAAMLNLVKATLWMVGLTSVCAAAQSAELPSRRANTQPSVKSCAAYGAGFIWAPSVNSCIRVGGSVAAEVSNGRSGARLR